MPYAFAFVCTNNDLSTDWPDAETDGKSGKSKNLWEESWDDDDTTDDFAAQLR